MTAESPDHDGHEQQRAGDHPGDESDRGEVPTNQTTTRHRPPPAERDSTWTTGEKYGVGTACDHRGSEPSRVWFTLTEGALTELRFPRVDLMNYRVIDFLVVDPGDGYSVRTHNRDRTGEKAVERTVELAASDALLYRHRLRAADDREWTLTVEYCTDPATESVLLDAAFEAGDDAEYDLYLIAEPAASGYVAGTRGTSLRDGDDGYALAAWEAEDGESMIRDTDGSPYRVATAITATGSFDRATVAGHETVEPLLTRGDAAAVLADEDEASGPAHRPGEQGGTPVMVGRLGDTVTSTTATLAIGFAAGGEVESALGRASESLARGYERVREEYVAGWRSYLDERSIPGSVADDRALAEQYCAAVMVLKAVESKQFPGASVASPSVPWGDNVDATVPRDYGYNFTWSRDLYQVFTALSAVDDVASAREALEYLYECQQREDGFLPQNTYLDGRTRWGGEQLDNVAFPAVMAYQLSRNHGVGFGDASYSYADVRRSLEYLLRSGPRSGQERWEEEAGYSPSTVAAQVAGLACGSALAADEGERADALAYLAHADWWREAVDDWCATDEGTGSHDRTPYFVRVTADGDPDSPAQRTLANNGPTLDERDVIDAGFLELVRLGLRDPEDPVVENSVAVVDETIRVETPKGPAWYRYNGDSYGELGAQHPDEGAPWSMGRSGTGRLWPIFTGERAEYELLRGTDGGPLAPANLLETMARFANSGRMIPEQVWDRPEETDYGWEFGKGTGSATPLAWSMAQYVRLAHAIAEGEPVETPAITERRYRGGSPDSPELRVSDPARSDGSARIAGETDGDQVVLWTPEETRFVESEGGRFECSVPLDRGEAAIVAATDTGDVASVGTAIERIDLQAGANSSDD